ncbi:dephospho-CoA kinase [Desulfurobacterium thermolithotrophum]|uniref:dephospho-CoA kinase n=1 Tax=Desulfurobacterium thermolithotrophum TaxID=64160 RepID=UPI0013D7ABCA|nr:dephospho-CoA kinase [Desulfurobacterium thermolithotrophum]
MLVGITGNIGSGKSTVSNILKSLGYRVFNADIIGKKILLKGRRGYKAVVREFGTEILKEDGEIDTKKLASMVFSDKKNLDKLTSITHPLILEEISLIKRIYTNSIVFVEAAVLFEYGWQKLFDFVVLVFAYKGQRFLRASRRFGLKEVIRRESFQLPYEKKLEYSDFLICNTENVLHLKEQVLNLVHYLEELET